MIIQPDSWHYRLYEKYACGYIYDLHHGEVNFCQYARKVFRGMLVVLVIILFGVIVLLGPLNAIGTVLLWAITDNPWIPFMGVTFIHFPEPASWIEGVGNVGWIILMVEVAIIVGARGVLGGSWLYDQYSQSYASIQMRAQYKEPKQPGFFKTWYRSWKDKYCPIMEVANPEEKE